MELQEVNISKIRPQHRNQHKQESYNGKDNSVSGGRTKFWTQQSKPNSTNTTAQTQQRKHPTAQTQQHKPNSTNTQQHKRNSTNTQQHKHNRVNPTAQTPNSTNTTAQTQPRKLNRKIPPYINRCTGEIYKLITFDLQVLTERLQK